MTTDLDRMIEAVEAGEWDHASAASSAEKWLMRKPGRYYGPAYSAFGGSIDAAVALLEALLPDWDWSSHGNGQATLWPPGNIAQQNAGAINTKIDDRPARALLLATLRAYRSTREGGG